ncbi:MAG TPA: isoprenylcysteine carboxylmethyltransferase family protein [Candidatus Acidoferrum sp.]
MGYPLALAVLFFARPQPRAILLGALVGAFGLALRAWAAGYLHKQELLTVTGPYAYTRNPLYVGSAFLALGAAIAARSWISALLLTAYFSVFYSVVMRKEESELRARHGSEFDRFAATVPLFFPRLSPARLQMGEPGSFSAKQYKKNHEWQAAVGFLLLLVVLCLIWWFRSS